MANANFNSSLPPGEYEEVGSIYSQAQAAAPQAPALPPGEYEDSPPRTGTTFRRGMNLGFGNVNVGMADIAGAPVDLVNWLMRQAGLPMSERPFGGSESMRSGLDYLGVTPTVEPETPQERAISSVGRTVGSSLPVTGGVFQAAKAAPIISSVVTPPAQSVVRNIARSTIQQAQQAPKSTLFRDIATAAGAGLGEQAAQESYPDNPLARTLGGLGGAAVVNMTPTSLATRAAQKGYNYAKDRVGNVSGFGEKARSIATEKALKSVDDAISANAGNVAKAQELKQKIPGLQTTITEETRSPVLRATQEAIEAEMKSPEIEKAIQRRAGNIERVEEFARSAAPASPAPPEIIVDVAKGRVDRLTASVEKKIEGVEARRQRIPETMQHGDRQEIGGRVRTALTEAMEERSKQFEKLADQWGINDAAIQAKGPLAEEGKKIMGLYSALMDKRFGPEASGLARALGIDRVNPEAPATFKAIKKIRENISKDIIEATAGGNVDRGEVRLLIALRTKIDSFVERLTEQAGTPELAANLKKFRAAYFQNYIKPFDEGVAVKIRQRDAHGFYRTPDENVGQTVWKSETSGRGALANIDKWREIFGPKRDDLLKDVIADDLYRSVVDNDLVNVRRLKAWQTKHQDALKKLGWDPSASVEAAEDAIARRLDTLRQRRDRIQDSVLASVTKGNKTATELLEGSIQNSKEWTSLVGTIRRSPEALPAARRLLFERVGAIQDPEKMLAFIDQNRKALAQIMTPRHLNDLRTLAEARKMVTLVPEPKGQPIDVSPLGEIEKKIGNPIQVVATRIYQGTTGRASPFWIITDRARAFIQAYGENLYNEALKEAISNPESARKFISGLGAPLKPGQYAEWYTSGRRVPPWLLGLGISASQRPDAEMTFRMEKPQQ